MLSTEIFTQHAARQKSVPGIYICCGLIDHQYFILPQNGSGKANQLSLAYAEIYPSLRHFSVQSLG